MGPPALLEPARGRSIFTHALPALVAYALVRRLFFRGTFLPEDVYHGPSVLLGALGTAKFWVAIVVPTLLLALRHRKLRWNTLGDLPQLRWFVTFICLIIAWAYATTDRNLYYDQSYLLDRWALIGLAMAVVLRPVFVWPFLGLAMAFVFQLHHAIGGFDWLDKVIVFESLLLFCAMLVLQAVRRQDWVVYFVLLAGLMASDYVIPALAKLQLQWLARDDLYALTASTYANGWLSFVPQERLMRWLQFLSWTNLPLKLATLAVELGALLLLWRRGLLMWLAGLSAGLHVAIYLVSGIFFWKWILLNLALMAVFWRASPSAARRAFGWRMVVLTGFVVATSGWHVAPLWLAWYDSRLSEYFDLEVVGRSGATYNVGRDWMSPYDLQFAQSRFYYLTEEPFLTGTFGAVRRDAQIYAAIEQCHTAADVHHLLRARGEIRFDPMRAEQFDRFLRRWFGAINAGRPKRSWLSWLKSPYHIWSFPRAPVFDGQEPVEEVRVWLRRTLYQNGTLVPVSADVVRRIRIEAEN